MERVMRVDIAIMTVREDEFTAVRKRFKTERRRIPDGRTYLIGEVKTEKQTYTIAIARCIDQANDASQRLAHQMIHDLDPRLILVVGIAGGVPRDEFTLGDVVVSTRIVNPNVDAWHPDGTTDYMTGGGPPHPLVENIVSLLPGEPQLAGWTDAVRLERPSLDPEQENLTGDEEWREKVRHSLNRHFGEEQNRGRPPTFTIGPILSSNHLMKDPARLREILKTHRAILAVEMEVAGVYEAAQRINHQYPIMAIRGISDVVGLQRDRRWTEYACQTAAAFTYAFIMTDPLDLPPNSVSFQKPVAPSEISSAQLRGSEPSLDTQLSAWHLPSTSLIPVAKSKAFTLIRTLSDFSGWTKEIAFSRDGQSFIGIGSDFTTKVWSPKTWQLLFTSKYSEKWMYSTAISPDGQILATTTFQGIKLWDLQSGSLLRTLNEKLIGLSGITSINFSLDGQVLSTRADDDTIAVWDLRIGKLLHTLTGYSSRTYNIAVSPDGLTFANVNEDGTINIWNWATNEILSTFECFPPVAYENDILKDGRQITIYHISFSPDGRILICINQDGTIALRDFAGQLLQILQVFHPFQIVFSLDGQLLATQSTFGFSVWNLYTGHLLGTLPLGTLPPHPSHVMNFAVAPNGHTLALGQLDGKIKIWTMK
jgi:WD40 repeat protein/nucleoside phosphorylase